MNQIVSCVKCAVLGGRYELYCCAFMGYLHPARRKDALCNTVLPLTVSLSSLHCFCELWQVLFSQ